MSVATIVPEFKGIDEEGREIYEFVGNICQDCGTYCEGFCEDLYEQDYDPWEAEDALINAPIPAWVA